MTNKNHSSNKTSDKIRKRSSELILKDKLKPDKILQNRQHKLDLERDKKTLCLSKIAIFLSLISLLFSTLAYFDTTPETTNIIQNTQAPSTAPAKTNQ